MFERFYPDEYVDSTYSIDFEKKYNDGFRGVIFDIDNTIITGVDFKIHIEKALREYGINDLEKLKIYLNNIKEYEKCHKSYEKDSYLSYFSKKVRCEIR